MPPTRKRTRKTQVEVEIPEKVVIKTEVIDESYEQFYTPILPAIKTENFDPSQVVVKQEPPDYDTFPLLANIKTEPPDSTEVTLSDNSNRKLRKSSRRTSSELSKSSRDSNSDEFRNDENVENLSSLVQPRETRSRKQSPPKTKENLPQISQKTNNKTQENNHQNVNNNNTESLDGCILHMKNILDVLNNKNNNINNNNNNNNISSTEEKKFRQRVEALIPRDLRFPVGNYKCFSCNVTFKLLSDWEDHIINFLQYKGCFPSEEGIAPLNQKFKDGWTSVDNKTFSCKRCSFETKHKQDVYQHITAKHDPQSHKCALCTKTFNTLHYLKNHLSYKHDPTRAALHCSYCDYKTIDKYSLATHERTKHTKEGYLKCDQCDVQTPTKYKMRLHILRAHSSDNYKKKNIKCSKCNYTTNECKRLREHFKRSHTDEDVYSCAYCRYKGSKHYLEIHIFKMHMKDKVVKKYKCDICDKMFPSEAGLLSHNRIIHSHGPETFTCKHCNLVFMTKHDCFIHTNIEHLSKPEFQCNECSFWAKDKDNLREHVFRKHRFTFHCAYCPFKTHAKLYIYIHINSRHNPNSKRYKCSKCKYVAKNKTLLKQHVNVKHNPNPILYTCYHCGHKNKIKHKLSQHMQTKHLNMLKKKKKSKKVTNVN